MPLIMEPLSAFYSSPLVVLDFQSLYPSIMIAYNYCYSTCLGRITDFKGTYKFGVTDLRQPAGLLDTLQDYINGGSEFMCAQFRKFFSYFRSSFSRAERDDVRQADSTQGVTGTYVNGAIGYESHGQAGDEGCQRR